MMTQEDALVVFREAIFLIVKLVECRRKYYNFNMKSDFSIVLFRLFWRMLRRETFGYKMFLLTKRQNIKDR